MKTRVLPLAAAVAMSCAAGFAQAVSVNNEGLGEVLLFPYYSAASGNDTLINIVNTTDYVKAVKVRFVEGMNSKEVLDFNLYLSPQDHWSGVVTSTSDGAKIVTGDTSCTVPAIPAGGQPFTNALYLKDSVNDLARTREGYVEVIEMGVVYDWDESDTTPEPGDQLASDATHINGVPRDCSALTAAWSANGVWLDDPTFSMSSNMGGLYGYGVLINVNEGTDGSYDAIALQAFEDPISKKPLHAAPGDSSPALGDAIAEATVIDNVSGVVTVVETFTATGLDAVSAVLMHDTISNDYVLEPTILAGTDWVITMPTKHDYVNRGRFLTGTKDLVPAWQPFTDAWDETVSKSCEQIGITYYDREEAGQTPSGVDFSPRPPEGKFSLCAEANVLTFNNSDVLGAKASGGNLSTNLDVIFDNGWMRIDLDASGSGLEDLRDTVDEDGDDVLNQATRVIEGFGAGFEGLPVIGFAIQKYVNGTLTVGGTSVLSNYAGIVTHKTTRDITIDSEL